MSKPMLDTAGKRFYWIAVIMLFAGTSASRPLTTELFMRGYSVIPSPRKVTLENNDVEFDRTWAYSSQLPAEAPAIRSLRKDLKEFYSIDLDQASSATKKVIALSVDDGTVKTGAGSEIDKQAYRMKITPSRIEIVGNSGAGLFYGVQTLLQLLKRHPQGNLLLPVCVVEDWPATQLRFLHWDTKHHQDRLETLKRYLDWSARFKINMIGFELEDKFEYPSHPVIGAPGAFTTAQLQEIVDYGLQRYIQVVPQIQSPAHMAYVLKHPEFADLRSDGTNYQACMCDERAYNLIFAMYDDVIRATKGVEYFHVSTDEVYYAGICGKCSRPYNRENRSLTWIDFANRAHEFMKERNRRMLAWVEYPVLAKHIHLLPPDLINGVMPEDEEQLAAEKQLGMRDLVYTSMQGEELLFPDNLTMEGGERSVMPGRLEETRQALSKGIGASNPIGVYGAAWDDSGLHGETFWLGWATVAQYGWKPVTPSIEQHIAEFMNIYYGPGTMDMVEVYRGLQMQAHFFDRSWDRVVSRVRGPAYGNSQGKGVGGTRHDRTLPAPALPALPALDFKPVYTGHYSELAERARPMLVENDVLQHRLHENIGRAERNRYNLEVFVSLAEFTRHYEHLILGMKGAEERLKDAREAALRKHPQEALERLAAAHEQIRGLVQERQATYEYLKRIWEKSRFPKGQEVNGRKFLHVMDDTKDHWADRRADLSYMTAPEESIGLEKWMQQLAAIAREYAKANGLPAPDLPE